jgi:hypothetical protein
MTLDRVPMPSPNYSSRGGTGVRLIVLHTAEGATTIESLGNFFASPSAGVSSHAGADDKPNTIGVYVERGNKAWTAANANPYAVQIELCAFARWTPAEWDAHPTMLANAAAWIAEEAAAFGIPIRELSDADAQGGAAGVCQHVDLGSSGGGHWDCGDGFPMGRVLDMAQGGTQPEPEPTPEPEDDMALTICRRASGDPQYLTDLGTFKTPIANPAARDAIVWCIVAAGGKLYYNPDVNDPVIVPDEVLDALPTTSP